MKLKEEIDGLMIGMPAEKHDEMWALNREYINKLDDLQKIPFGEEFGGKYEEIREWFRDALEELLERS